VKINECDATSTQQLGAMTLTTQTVVR